MSADPEVKKAVDELFASSLPPLVKVERMTQVLLKSGLAWKQMLKPVASRNLCTGWRTATIVHVGKYYWKGQKGSFVEWSDGWKDWRLGPSDDMF